MTTVIELREAVDAAMRRGESLSTVADEIIEPSRLSDDAKSALWLYAWSFVNWRAQRREASARIARIARIAASPVGIDSEGIDPEHPDVHRTAVIPA
jgi:hypothetical protein